MTLHRVTQQRDHVLRERGAPAVTLNWGKKPTPATPAAFPALGLGKGLLLVTSGHQWPCVMGMLPGLCFKYADGICISFKVGTKVMIN